MMSQPCGTAPSTSGSSFVLMLLKLIISSFSLGSILSRLRNIPWLDLVQAQEYSPTSGQALQGH